MPGQTGRPGARLPASPASRGVRAAGYAVPMSAETPASADFGAVGTRATLAEVASLADVSISTVSKVLNGRSGVSDETRARIESLLADHRYNRRNPGPNPAPLLEVLCYEIDSLWASVAIAAIERLARENGVGVVVSGTHSRTTPDDGWFEGMLSRRSTAVILVATDLPGPLRQQLRSRGIPLVMLDPAGSPAPDVPSIGSADWTGAYAAARHLTDLGHRSIAMITGPEDMMAATARLSGFRAALESAGVPVRPEYLRRGEFHHRDGLSQGHALLTLPEPPTAIFAAADVQALGVYEAARTLGVAIPAQLSVVGFDDLRVAQWAGPALTTVRVPIAEMAEEAAQLALRLRDEEEPSISRIDMATTLVVRDSTAPPANS
jgi:LacI family transcriptional regulator, xylobiose transport system transcriptional regulator